MSDVTPEPTPETPELKITPIADEVKAAVTAAIEAERQRSIDEQEAQAEAAKAQAYYNPSAEAVQVVRTQEALIREAMSAYPDAPTDLRDKLEEKMARFSTPESLAAAKKEGLHRTLANDIVMQAAQSGTYVPEKFRAAPKITIEPAHSEPVFALSNETQADVSRISASMGVDITPEDIQREMAHMADMGGF